MKPMDIAINAAILIGYAASFYLIPVYVLPLLAPMDTAIGLIP